MNFEIAGKNFSKMREYSTVVASQFSFLEAGGAGVGVGGGGGGDDGGGEGGSDVFNKQHEHRSRIYLVKRIQCDDFYTINSNQYNFLSFFCAYLKISICIWHLGVTMICGVTDHYLKETRAFS